MLSIDLFHRHVELGSKDDMADGVKDGMYDMLKAWARKEQGLVTVVEHVPANQGQVHTHAGSVVGTPVGASGYSESNPPQSPGEWSRWIESDPETALKAYWKNFDNLPESCKTTGMQQQINNAAQEHMRSVMLQSQMMTALHEMMMAVVRNLKV